MTIGSTNNNDPYDMRTPEQLRGDMKDIHKARLSLREKATVQGITSEIEVLKQQLEMTHEQMRRLIGMYQTLTEEFKQFKDQRIRELQMKVNCGSTSPEDD